MRWHSCQVLTKCNLIFDMYLAKKIIYHPFIQGEEGYDEAAHVNQKISQLVDQCESYKYQHPVLDQKVESLINSK